MNPPSTVTVAPPNHGNGKGHAPRPFSVPFEKFGQRFDNINWSSRGTRKTKVKRK